MTTYVDQTKNTSSYTNAAQNQSSYSNPSKSVSNDYLLLEDGDYLLQETDDKLILDQSTGSGTQWSDQSKS